MKEAVAAAYPQTELQRCIVHQVRNTLKYVGEKNKKEFADAPQNILISLRCAPLHQDILHRGFTNGSIQFILKKERERPISRSYHKVIFLQLIVFTEVFFAESQLYLGELCLILASIDFVGTKSVYFPITTMSSDIVPSIVKVSG